MTLGNGFTIGAKGYGLIVEQKKGAAKKFLDVDGELKELESKTAYFAEVSHINVIRDRAKGSGVS